MISFLSFLISTALVVVLTYPTVVLAGRPLAVDDAPAVPPGHLEWEFGATHSELTGGGWERKLPLVALSYGVWEKLELGIAFNRLNTDPAGGPRLRGLEDLHLTGKFNFLAATDIFPALAFAMDVKAPTANRRKGLSTGQWDETFLLIASRVFSPFALHLNFGYQIVDSPAEEKLNDRYQGGLALEWPLGGRWVVVSEVSGHSRRARGEPHEAQFQVGARYPVSAALVLDVAVGRSLRSSGTELQATIGFTWTFPVGVSVR